MRSIASPSAAKKPFSMPIWSGHWLVDAEPTVPTITVSAAWAPSAENSATVNVATRIASTQIALIPRSLGDLGHAGQQHPADVCSLRQIAKVFECRRERLKFGPRHFAGRFEEMAVTIEVIGLFHLFRFQLAFDHH